MYASQIWWNFRKSCMQRLHVAYNFGCRALYNLPWRASVSRHAVAYLRGSGGRSVPGGTFMGAALWAMLL